MPVQTYKVGVFSRFPTPFKFVYIDFAVDSAPVPRPLLESVSPDEERKHLESVAAELVHRYRLSNSLRELPKFDDIDFNDVFLPVSIETSCSAFHTYLAGEEVVLPDSSPHLFRINVPVCACLIFILVGLIFNRLALFRTSVICSEKLISFRCVCQECCVVFLLTPPRSAP